MGEVRAAVLVAVGCGLVAVAVAGVTPVAVSAAGLVLLVAAVALSAAAPPSWHRVLRGTALVVVAVTALVVLTGLTADLGRSLVPLLVGVSVASALTWSSPRDLRSGLLCAAALLVAASAFARDVLVAPPLVLGWVAVLVAGLRLPSARLAADPSVVQPPSPPGRHQAVGRLAPALGLALALAVVAFLLLPPPGAPRLPVPDQAQGGAGAGSPSASSGTRAAFSSPVMDLTQRVGELSTEPVLEVDSDSPPLWRSTVYDAYDGRSWSTGERPERLMAGRSPYRLAGPDRPTRTDVAVTSRHDGTVWAPGPVRELGPERLPPAVVDGEGAVRLAGPTRAYQVVSALPPDEQTVRAAAGADVDDPRWLQLPADLPQRVRDLGRQLTASAPTRLDAAVAVERWLEASATYRLDPPVPGPGEDAVDRFLFVDRIGFCQQFAAASAVLLRSAGIPARVVTGLGYGIDRGSRRTYQVQHLHAWTEVYHPGVGWVAMDATPAADLAEDDASARDRLATWLTDLLRRTEDAVGGRRGLAAVLVAVLAAGVAVVLLRRRRARRRSLDRSDRPDGPQPLQVLRRPALAAFLRLDARLGAAARRREESLAEMRRRLHPPEEVAAALTVVEQECYAPVPPPHAETAAAVLDAVDAAGLTSP